MSNTPNENKNLLTLNKIFVTLLVIAIIVFIVKSTTKKKPDKLQISQYKSFTNYKSNNVNTANNLKQLSSENKLQKNIVIATFSQKLPTPPVNDIKIDKFKRVWLATEKGVYKIENDELTEFTYENGKYPFAQASCLETDGNNLWVGSLYGICVYNESGKFVNKNDFFPLPSKIIWDILWDGEQLWISTQKGISFFNSTTIDNIQNGIKVENDSDTNESKILNETNTNNGLKNSWCTKIAKYSNWLAVTHDDGLSFLNIYFNAADPRSWKNINHAKSSISRPIHDIVFDGKNIWLGTPTGLMMINTPLSEFESNFSPEMIIFSELHGLPSNNINSMVYSKNTIWLGTSKGLARIRNNKIQSINDITGEQTENIRKLAIQGDSDNMTLLWIGTNTGIQFINTQMAD